MNIVKYHQPKGKLGGITVKVRVYQGRKAYENDLLSVAKCDRQMLARGYVRGKGGAA